MTLVNDFTLILDNIEGDEKAFSLLSWRIMSELESCREFRSFATNPSSSERMLTFIEDMWERVVPFTHHTSINRRRFFLAAAESTHITAVLMEEDRKKRMRSRLRKMGYKHMPILPVEDEDISRFMTEAIVRYEKQDRTKADLQKLKFYLHMTMAELADLLERPEEDVTAD